MTNITAPIDLINLDDINTSIYDILSKSLNKKTHTIKYNIKNIDLSKTDVDIFNIFSNNFFDSFNMSYGEYKYNDYIGNGPKSNFLISCYKVIIENIIYFLDIEITVIYGLELYVKVKLYDCNFIEEKKIMNFIKIISDINFYKIK